MSAFHDNALMGASGQQGYKISRSVRLRSSASAYFNRTPASAGNRKTWTWSDWVKRGTLGTRNIVIQAEAGGNTNAVVEFNSSDQLRFFQQVGSVDTFYLTTTQVFRDPSAWYHLMVVLDTTQATNTNRMKIYVNGVQITSFSSSLYPSQNFDGSFNNNVAQYIGTWLGVPAYFDGYHTEVNFIDGQALTPSSFGETDSITGVWKPKKYAGTYGTNGFYLNFSDNSSNTATTIGKDYSGNGNNWTPNNISVTAGATYDSMIDVPTPYADGNSGRGNYAVLNPVSGYSVTLTNGNLTYTTGTSANPVTSTWSLPTTGKWYWEVTASSVGEAMIGIQTRNNLAYSGPKTVYYRAGGASSGIYIEGTVNAYAASSYTNNDVIAVAFDADASQISWYKNNVQQGGPYSLTSLVDLTPIIIQGSGSGSNSGNANFGQRPFSYTPPTGFVALNTQNLPTPTISNGANYMAASLFTGTSGNVTVSNAVNGISFQPDFLWFKARSNAQGHSNVDSVRGASKLLQTNLTNAESTLTNPPTFNADGFTSTTDIHTNGYTYVAWQWKASGSTVSNTSGSITSTVSAGATQGFSVVTYTGTGANATVGHGLGVAPKMIITKPRNSADNWISWHTALGNLGYIYLNTTGAAGSGAAVWNSTLPSSTVFSIGTSSNINSSGQTQVAYCFAAVAGYSAFGSYTGNGSTDGPFVFTNFRPRWVMIKRTDTAGENWEMWDSSRGAYNIDTPLLYANLSNAETAGSAARFDALSNGFKIRSTNAGVNASGGTYVYAAFCESPFKIALAR